MATLFYTDSCCDLPKSYTQQRNAHVIPLMFRIGDKDFLDDGESMPNDVFYSRIRAGETSTTSQITQHTYENVFRPHLQAGDDVIYLAFSSGLSGSCESAMNAAASLKKEFPDRTLYVIDSLAASMGQGLLFHHMLNLRDEGMEDKAIVEWVEAHKQNLAHWVTVDDLNHLRRGGRVSATAAFLGTMLSIKVIIHVDDEGKLIPVEKVKGRKRALATLVERMKETAIEPAGQTIFISHGDCLEDCQAVEKMVREALGVKEVMIHPIGPVIGAHSGPGTIALFFLAEHK